MSEAADLAMELMGCACGLPSPGAESVKSTRVNELAKQLALTRAAVLSVTGKVSILEKEFDKAQRVHHKLLKKIRAEPNTVEDQTVVERDSAVSCYHGVLRSIQKK